MSSHTVSQPSTNVHRTLGQYAAAFGLIFVSIAVAIIFVAAPATPQASVGRAATEYSDPAVQGVAGYIQAHAAVQSTPVEQDPAAQGVAGYLQAHAAVQSRAVAADPAVQGVAGYLQAHAAVQAPVATVEPAVQSVFDYLRVHSR